MILLLPRGIIMIRIHLSKLLGERRMTQKRLSELTGIRRNAINEWYHEIVVSLKVEHIDRICEVLDCSVEELIEYIPDKVPKTGKHWKSKSMGTGRQERDSDKITAPFSVSKIGKYFPKVFDIYFENL